MAGTELVTQTASPEILTIQMLVLTDVVPGIHFRNAYGSKDNYDAAAEFPNTNVIQRVRMV